MSNPIINLSAGTTSSESGLTIGTFNITLSASTATPLTVNFNTTGSANKFGDYTFDLAASSNIIAITDTSFTIAAGVTNATLAIKPVDDAVTETGGERVRVNLLAGTGYSLAPTNSAFADFTVINNSITGLDYSKSVAVADFNRDGKLDVVTDNFSTLSVILGQGNGSFGTVTNIPIPNVNKNVAVADFNADGNPDIVTNRVSVLLGNGDGSFGKASNYPAVNSNAIAVGDFNGDGKPDIAAPNNNSNNSSWVLLGQGNGSFIEAPAQKFIPSLNYEAAIASGDFNEDGLLDLLAVERNRVRLLLGNGDGTFVKGSEFFTNSISTNLATGDFNGDKHLDLATGVSVFLGNGQGTFSQETKFTVGSSPDNITVGDFNSDGKLDLATSNRSTYKSQNAIKYGTNVSFFLGNGDGSFKLSTDFLAAVANSPSNYAPTIASGDFNGDNKSDVVTTIAYSNILSVLLDSNPTSASLAIADNDPFNIVSISPGNNPNETGPTNGSFNITLTSPAPAGGLTVNYSLATGNNAATPGTDYQLVAGNNLTAVTATSFTIAAGATTATLNVAPVTDNAIETNETVGITLERGTGYGLAFGNTAEVKFAPTTNSFSVDSKPFLGDFNRDGFLDLLTPGYGVGWVFFGKGNGNFEKATQSIDFGSQALLGPAAPEYFVTMGDVNGDGNLDFASAPSKVNNRIAVVLGNGDGTFAKATHLPVNSKSDFSLSRATGDFNADGNLDLIGSSEGIVSLLLGTGTGNFSAPIVSKVEAGNDFFGIAAQDFNGDGKLDLLGRNWQSNSVSLILGKGDGTFEKATKLPNSAVMDVADFNSDGKFDLVTANYTNYPDKQIQASVFLGNGNGSFNDPTKFIVKLDQNPPIPSSIGSLAVSDFDGDGKIDIAVTSVANNYAADVWFITGNGDGTFGKATKMPIGQVSSSNQLASWISAADFNGDGQSDLVTGANSSFLSSHKAFVLLNNNKPTADLTIADSDPNAKNITLAVSPSSAMEDGTTNLVYTFTRTGDLTNSLTVNFIVGGNATFGSDYTQTGTAVFSETKGTITFAANSNTATLTIDPTADALIEPDESVELTLAPGTDYTILTSKAVAGTIANDDSNNPPTVSNLNISGDEDTNLIFKAADFTSKFSDTNGDNLTKIQVTSLPNNGLLKLLDANVTVNQEIPVAELGNLRFTPNPNWNGNTSFNWNGFDGTTYALSPATVNLAVNSVNDAPFVSASIPINQTAAVNSLYNFTFPADTFSDVDSGDSLTYSATPANSNPLPNWLSFNPITRTFVGIPTNSDVGTMSVLIKATDGANASTFASFNLTVTNPAPDCFCETIIRPDSDNISGVDTTPNPVDAIQLGSDLDDILIGTDAGDSLNGLGGKDWIFGKAGKDNLIGGADDDIIFGGSDRDYILGDSGDDFLSGNKGDDYIQGNPGNDIIWAGQGNDLARGGKDDDLVFGDKGDDTLTGNKGNDIIYGGDGRDLVFAGSEDDVLYGNIGDDTLFADDGNDTVYGGQNDDIVFGDKGNDWLAGDRGNDSLCGGDGNDTAYGGSEDDEICGGDGNDLLFGNQGEDTLNGELGDDTLYGGKDNDTIIGGAGNDWLHGGKGKDVFLMTAGWGVDAIADFTDGEDLLGLTGGLIFPLLAIKQNNNDTTISVKSSGEILAILTGIGSNQIGQEDFV